MKVKLIITALVATIFFGCNSNEDKNEEVIHETVRDTVSAPSSVDSAVTITNNPSQLWIVEMQQNSKLEKLKKPANDSLLESFSPTEIIAALNGNFSDVQLQLKKISHDTIYVSIPDSKKLTQEMGNTGAENYLASAVFNLTELKNVKYVNFDMKEGDHAGPGVFSRNDFKRLR